MKKNIEKEGPNEKPAFKKPRTEAAHPTTVDEESLGIVEDNSDSGSGSEIEDAFLEEQPKKKQTEKGETRSSKELTKADLENAIRSITEQLDDDRKG